MVILFYILVFLLGSAVGSFLGVVVDRLVSKEPIWKGRSHCDHCRHTLHVLDLFPIVSFVVLKGKCRYCHKRLSWFYPLIELCTGFIYIAATYTVLAPGFTIVFPLRHQLLLLYYFIVSSAFIVIFFADLRYGIIPFKLVATAFITTLLWYILIPFLSFTPLEMELYGLHVDIVTTVLAAVGAGGFFLLLFLITKGRGMGFGDVVYAFLMGFTLGYPRVFLGLYLAFVTGAVVSLTLVAFKKKRLRGGTIPFGPFLVSGTLISLLWGNAIITHLLLYLTR